MRKLGQSYSDADAEADARRSRSQDVRPHANSSDSYMRRDSTLPSTSRRRPTYQTQSNIHASRVNQSGLERSTSIRDRASQFLGIGESAPADDVAWQRRRLRHLHRAYGLRPNEVPVAPPAVAAADRNISRAPRSRSASNADQIDVLGEIVDGLPPEDPHTDKARISRAFSINNGNTVANPRDSALKIAVDAIYRIAMGKPSASQANLSTLSRYQGTRQSGSISRKRGWSFLPNPYIENEFIPAQPAPTTLGPIAETSFISNVTDRPHGVSDPTPMAVRSFSMRRPSAVEPSPPPRRSRTRPDSLNLLGHTEMGLSRSRYVGGRDFHESLPLHPLSPIFDEATPSAPNETFFMSPQKKSRGPTVTTESTVEEGTSTPPFPLVSPEGPSEPPPMPPLAARPIQGILKVKERAVSNLDTSYDSISCWEYLRKRFRQKVPADTFNLETMIQKTYRVRDEPKSLPFGVEFAKKKKAFIEKQLEDETLDYRPFFTYWITTVQIIVTILSIAWYGFAPFSLTVTHRSGDVMAASLSIVHIEVMELPNSWLGPRYEDLIHIGAKYTPCMRRDLRIMQQIEGDRVREATDTGCCWSQQPSSSKSSGDCYQTSDCPTQISKQFMWANQSAGIRAVCGQDPRYCRHSESWGKDISKWPTCASPITQYSRNDVHMTCRIRGRPCCIQLHGQCRITTREYCTFVHGTYHENATLCSQVSCLSDVCGMVPFIRPEHPDQLIRFVTPLFIHAGIIQLAVTVWLQMYYMISFEKLIGAPRILLIYFCSGICGYLASATFVPYLPQVGPSGAHSGIVGALTVNVIYNWKLLLVPVKALACHILIAAAMFLLGFLPYIDNVGQIVGFIVGSALAGALIPYMGVDRKVRVLASVFCLLVTIVIFVILITLFVIKDPSQLWDIGRLTCFDMSLEGICDQQSLKLRDWLPI
uniref:Rhomboid domain-containing protein n=1 Tax=Panagrellus redivivus TaxID=6233 RepID=A0A7E4VQ09_PANRE